MKTLLAPGALPVALLLGAIFVPAMTVEAGRIKLTALPVRDRVEIRLDNGRYTLVEEERVIPLLKSTIKTGNNRIDFSWSNTHIDRDSIQFRTIAILEDGEARPIRVRDGRAEIAVINVAYPPGENALVWEVFAAEGVAAKVRVSYLIDNLTRLFQYKAVANRAETELELRQYLQIANHSGEAFGPTSVWMGYADRLLDPKAVGQQENVKMLLQRFSGVPIRKTYTYDWYRFGPLNAEKSNASKVLMHYELANERNKQPMGGLGVRPLEAGKVRLFIEDGRGGQAFLGEDWGKLTPIGAKMRLYMGEARDVVCERMVRFKETRDIRGNLDDLDVVIRYSIENFKPQAVRLDIIEQLDRLADQFYPKARHGHVEWTRGARTSDDITVALPYGGSNPVLQVELPARPKDGGAGTQPNQTEAVEKTTIPKTVVTFQFTIKNLWK